VLIRVFHQGVYQLVAGMLARASIFYHPTGKNAFSKNHTIPLQ
jgi:hypothetical protein